MSYYQTAIALGILIQMDERDVLALGRKKQDIQKGGQPTFKRPSTPAKAETPAHSPAKEWKPPAGNRGYSKEELKLMFPSAFSGKLGCAKGVKIHLELDPGVRPVRQKLRPITVPP